MKKFQRTIEDFDCGNCFKKIFGNGFTNHCPQCLWSKHVDVNPGDREEKCGGLMKPITVIKRAGEYFIVHQCLKCGFERKNKFSKEDSFDSLLKIGK